MARVSFKRIRERAAKRKGGEKVLASLLPKKRDNKALAKLGDELRFALITSAAQTAPLADAPADAVVTEVEGLKLKILKSAHAKCGRCWHFRADVGSHADHPELCSRCVSNIEGEGEVRKHA